jgi:hypothetical protein
LDSWNQIYDGEVNIMIIREFEMRNPPFNSLKLMVNQSLIGKYINQRTGTDVNPVGKIVGIKGKSTLIIQPIVASNNLIKMNFIEGGFVAHCDNQNEQRYEFTEQGDVFEFRISNASLKNRHWSINSSPFKFYDYNF